MIYPYAARLRRVLLERQRWSHRFNRFKSALMDFHDTGVWSPASRRREIIVTGNR
jgi:hypothetical protein